jgi:hypothetical protein
MLLLIWNSVLIMIPIVLTIVLVRVLVYQPENCLSLIFPHLMVITLSFVSLGVKITLTCIIEDSVWVKVASMHFEGTAARWLQSVNHKIHSATWSELCSWIHERFGKDQHEILIRQLYHMKQIGSIQDYIDKFSGLVDQLQTYSHSVDPLYYTTRTILISSLN